MHVHPILKDAEADAPDESRTTNKTNAELGSEDSSRWNLGARNTRLEVWKRTRRC